MLDNIIKEQAELLIKEEKPDEAFQLVQSNTVEMLKLYAGLVYGHKFDIEKTIQILKFVISIDPNHANTCSNISTLLSTQHEYEEALEWIDKAIALGGLPEMIHNNRGVILSRLGKYDEAIAYYKERLKINPDFEAMQNNLGCYLAHVGNLSEAWAKMEERFKSSPRLTEFRQRFNKPDWQGEDVDRLLIYSEQGIGDLFQFIRYLPQVKLKANKVFLECQEECASLLKLSDIEVIPRTTQIPYTSNLPEYDKVVSISSLPYIFKADLDNISGKPYIKVTKTNKFDHLLQTDKIKVGIVWAGSIDHSFDFTRSCKAIDFLPLIDDNIQLYNLQKGKLVRETPQGIIDRNEGIEQLPLITPVLNDFLDTAQFIDKLDYVVSICTAVAHLSGAMGKKTCVILSTMNDWRWMQERVDSPWYDSVKLFRQTKVSNWSSPVKYAKEYILKN